MASKNTVAISLLAMFDQQSANKTTESFQKMIQEIGKMMRSQKISTKDFMDVRGNITDFKKFEKAIQDVGVSISGVMGKAKGDVTSFSTVMTKLNGSVNISNFAKNRFGEFEKESEVNSRKALPPVKQLNENYNNLIRAKKELNSLEKKGIVSGESYDKAIKNVERLKIVTQEYVDTLARTYKLKISDSGMIAGKGSIAQTQRRGQYESLNLDDNRRIIQAENQKQQEIKKTSTALSEYLSIRTKVSQMEAQGVAGGAKYTTYKEAEIGARPSNLEFDKDGALIANKKNADELGMSVQKLTANVEEYNRTMSLKKADIVSKQQSENMRAYTSSLKEQRSEEVQLKKLQTSGVDKDIIAKQQEAVTAIANRTNRLKGLVQGTEEYKKAEEELIIAEKKHNSAMEQVSDQTKKSTGLFANFATQFKQTFNTVVQAGLSWKVFSLMQQGLSKVAENVVELDKSLVNLQMATGGTKDETQELLTTYTEMAQELGSTTVEVADAADQWLRQGYSIQNTNQLVKDSMILSKIGQLDSADATQYLTSAMKGYKLSAEDAINIVDKLSAVDLKSATSTAGLALAMSRTANSADMMGISMDKLLGYLATIGEVTQKEMSSIGESVKTMLARMGNIKIGKFVDDESAEDLSDVSTILNKFGIQLFDAEGNFRNFGDVLDEVASKWNGYSNVEQSAIAVAISGQRQRENFLVLMNNYGKATEYMSIATDSAGTALDKFGAYEDSIEAKSKRLQASFESLSQNLLNSSLVKFLYDFGSSTVQVVDSLGLLQKAFIFLTTLASFKEVSNIANSFGLLGGNVKKTGFIMKTFNTTVAKNNAIMKLNLFSVQAATDGTNRFNIVNVATGKIVGNAATSIDAETAALNLSATAMSGAQKKAVALQASMGWISLALAIVVPLIMKFVDSIETSAERAEKANEAYESVKSELDGINTELQTATDRINELNNLPSLTFAEKDELQRLKDITSELKAQQKIKEAQAKLAEDTAFREEEALFKKQYGNGGITKEGIDEEKGKERVSLGGLESNKTDIELQLATYEKQLARKKELENKILNTKDEDSLLFLQQNLKISEQFIAESNNNILEGLSAYQAKYDRIMATEESDRAKKFGADWQNQAKRLQSAIRIMWSTVEIGKNVGLPVENVVAQFAKAAEEAKLAEKDFASLADTMSLLGDKSNLIKSVNKDIEDFGIIQSGTIKSIMEKYPQLTDELVKYQLGLRSNAEIMNDLQGAYDVDYKNFKELAKTKLAIDGGFYQSALENKGEEIKQINEAYDVDLTNFKNAENAKLELQVAILKQMGINQSEYVGMSIASMEEIATGMSPLANDPVLHDTLRAAKKAQGIIDGLVFGDFDVKFSPEKFEQGKGKGGTGKETDLYLEAYNKEYAELKHLRAMDEIDDKQYYDRLLQLNNNYFLNKAKYTDNYKKNLEELHSLELSINEKAFNDRMALSTKYIEERNYHNDWGTDNEIAAYDRVLKWLENDFYKKGIIDYEKYMEQRESILHKRLEAQKKYLESQKSIMDSQIAGVTGYIDDEIKKLEDEKEARENLNKEVEKAITLAEIQEKLRKARENKTVRIFKQGIGFVYEADMEEIKSAEKELEDFKFQEQIDEIDKQINAWEKYKEEWQSIPGAFQKEQDRLNAAQIIANIQEAKNWTDRIAIANAKKNEYNAILQQINDINGEISSGGNSSGGKSYDPSVDYSALINGGGSASQLKDWEQKRNEKIDDLGLDYEKTHKYAVGTKNSQSGIAITQERGNELLIDNPKSGKYTFLRDGSGVLPANLTESIFSLATNPTKFFDDYLSKKSSMNVLKNYSTNSANNKVPAQINFGNIILPNVQDANGFAKAIETTLKSKAINLSFNNS